MLTTRSILTSLLVLLALGASTVAADELTPLEQLGKLLFFDTNLSTPPGQSCATCHAPAVGFTGPISEINAGQVAYPGAVARRAGDRKPPTSAYADMSPVFYYDEVEDLFIGGMFWDGRATGWTLGDPLAEQAQGPFLNPVEQNNPNAKFVCKRVAKSDYANLFVEVWGPGSLDPVNGVPLMYERIARSISAYEASAEVNPFTSKYDHYLAGMAELTAQEAWGLQLFEGAAMCSACHISEPSEDGAPPLFTDFTYDNLGIPTNFDLPVFDRMRIDDVDVGLDDAGGVAVGGRDVATLADDDVDRWFDPGLGGFLARVPEYAHLAEDNLGKFKVPTLRNVDLRPYPEFVKAYGHNGFFKSLEEITHFYNTRDVEPWPEPEYAETMNTDELGNLGLTPDEEAAVVAFMKTLNDGWMPPAGKTSAGASKLRLTFVPERDLAAPVKLSFTMPAEANAVLDVFDIRGHRVSRLVQDRRAAGEHTATLRTEHLASGVYLARLIADGQIATTKFSVVR